MLQLICPACPFYHIFLFIAIHYNWIKILLNRSTVTWCALSRVQYQLQLDESQPLKHTQLFINRCISALLGLPDLPIETTQIKFNPKQPTASFADICSFK